VTYLTTSRWHCKHVSFLAYVCVLGGAQVQPMKFGEDRTMYAGGAQVQPMKFGEDQTMYAKVISDFVFCSEQ